MQVPSEGVRVLSGECLGFFLREVDNALAGKDVNSHIDVRLRYQSRQLRFERRIWVDLTSSLTNLYALTLKILELRYDFGVPQSLKINMRVLNVSGLLLMKLYGSTS